MSTPIEHTADSLALMLARLEVKLDQLLETAGDHEARLRKLEEQHAATAAAVQSAGGGRSWQVILANALLTAINAAVTGSVVVGG